MEDHRQCEFAAEWGKEPGVNGHGRGQDSLRLLHLIFTDKTSTNTRCREAKKMEPDSSQSYTVSGQHMMFKHMTITCYI